MYTLTLIPRFVNVIRPATANALCSTQHPKNAQYSALYHRTHLRKSAHQNSNDKSAQDHGDGHWAGAVAPRSWRAIASVFRDPKRSGSRAAHCPLTQHTRSVTNDQLQRAEAAQSSRRNPKGEILLSTYLTPHTTVPLHVTECQLSQ